MTRSILVVEDDSISRFMMEEMCAKLGHSCKAVLDGERCLQEVTARPDAYSAILMDIHMPKLSGVEATATIRAADTDPPKNLPILAVTADDYWQNPHRCRANGFDGVLSKPVTIARLREVLERFLGPRPGV